MAGIDAYVRDNSPLLAMWAAMIAAASYCHATMKLPNWLTAPMMFGGLILGAIHDGGARPDAGVGGVKAVVACVVLAFGMLAPWYAGTWFPAGGVKLQMGFAACLGAFYGVAPAVPMVAAASIASPAALAILGWAKAMRLRRLDPGATGMMPVGLLVTVVAMVSVIPVGLLAHL
jgi:hypothetical protein